MMLNTIRECLIVSENMELLGDISISIDSEQIALFQYKAFHIVRLHGYIDPKLITYSVELILTSIWLSFESLKE